MSSIFTKIINHELPAYRIFEDELTIAILTIEPIRLGHTLVIPKVEVSHWFEVPEPHYTAVARVAKAIAPAIKAATGCNRILTTAIGFEVPHYHLHLIPAQTMADYSFQNAKKRSEQEMLEIQKKIIQHLKS